MSHKSGGVIINAMIPEGGQPLSCLSTEECERLSDIRQRDEYNPVDRLYLGLLVASHADDAAD
jgi:hypothetical protein